MYHFYCTTAKGSVRTHIIIRIHLHCRAAAHTTHTGTDTQRNEHREDTNTDTYKPGITHQSTHRRNFVLQWTTQTIKKWIKSSGHCRAAPRGISKRRNKVFWSLPCWPPEAPRRQGPSVTQRKDNTESEHVESLVYHVIVYLCHCLYVCVPQWLSYPLMVPSWAPLVDPMVCCFAPPYGQRGVLGDG